MSLTSSFLQSQRAPCGQSVDVECLSDYDEECQLSSDLYFACGCRSVFHEYHDGSVYRKTTHHDGRTIVDELLAEHHV